MTRHEIKVSAPIRVILYAKDLPGNQLIRYGGGHAVCTHLVASGQIDIDGQFYDYDVVIEKGKIHKQKKKPSKAYREQYGHTPPSADEAIPF